MVLLGASIYVRLGMQVKRKLRVGKYQMEQD